MRARATWQAFAAPILLSIGCGTLESGFRGGRLGSILLGSFWVCAGLAVTVSGIYALRRARREQAESKLKR